MPTTPALAAIDRAAAALALTRAEVERTAELHDICAEAHRWFQENRVGSTPQLAALMGRLGEALGK